MTPLFFLLLLAQNAFNYTDHREGKLRVREAIKALVCNGRLRELIMRLSEACISDDAVLDWLTVQPQDQNRCILEHL